MKKGLGQKLISCMCVAVLVFASLALPVQAARSKQEVQQDIETKKQLLEELEGQISANQNNKAEAEKALAEYEKQVALLVELVDEKEVLLQNTQEDLKAKTEELADTIVNIQDTQAMFEERLVAIYEINTTGAFVKALLGVENLSQMMQVGNTMKRVAEHDTELLNTLNEQRAAYEVQKTELEDSISETQSLLADLEADRDYLAAKAQEQKSAIASLNAAIAADVEEKKLTEEEKAALESELAAILEEANRRGSQKGDGSERHSGPLVWPVPGGRFTSGFGAPRSNTGWHYGIDISAAAGTPVVAAAAGTVIIATSHYSYGNYLVIDHGDGLRTLYAHNSSLAVGVGQAVGAGETVAYVGSTGDSTGNHLHFEVHDGGTRVDPMGSGYLNP